MAFAGCAFVSAKHFREDQKQLNAPNMYEKNIAFAGCVFVSAKHFREDHKQINAPNMYKKTMPLQDVHSSTPNISAKKKQINASNMYEKNNAFAGCVFVSTKHFCEEKTNECVLRGICICK